MTAATFELELQGSRAALFALLRGLSEEQFRFTPRGESWCVATHLAHLLRIERLFVGRARRALDEDEPRVESSGVTNDDEPALAQHLAVPQIVHGMLNARRDAEALLACCDDAAMARAFVHPRFGRLTVRDVFVKLRDHEREHTAEVARLVRQVPPSARVTVPLMRRS